MSALILRADGGQGMGVGHLVRSLALAEGWARAGGRPIFVTATTKIARQIGVHVPLQDIGSGETNDDASATAATASREAARWIVCDGARFDAPYVETLHRAGLRVMSIVDGPTLDPVTQDLVLDQNIGAERRVPSEDASRWLVGTRYALIREAILRHGKVRDIPSRVRRIVLLAGGADVAGLIPRFMRAFDAVAVSGQRCDVIVGPATTMPAARALDHRRLTIHRNPSDPGRIIAAADLALSAAGSTCWELCYLGVPMILVAVAEDQRRNARGLADAGAAVDMGWHADVSDDDLAVAIGAVLENAPRRRAMSARGREIVDGRGADRVVAALAVEDGSQS